MKRLYTLMILFVVMLVAMSANTVWAVTYAYIPSFTNDSLVRINTTEPVDSDSYDSVSLLSATDDPCGPHGIAITPNGSYVLVTCETGNALAVVSTSGFSSSSWYTGETGDEPRGVAVDPNGDYAYIVNHGSNTVVIARVSSPSDQTIVGEGSGTGEGYFDEPWGVAAIYDESASEDANEDVRKIYVANNGAADNDHRVAVITHTGTDSYSFDYVTSYSGSQPIGVAASPDGRYVYVANFGSNNVSVIRTSDDRQVDSISVSNQPWGVTVGAMGDFVFVSNSGSASATIIDTENNSPSDTRTTDNAPYGIAAPRNGDFAYVVSHSGTIPITKIWTPDSSESDADIPDDGNHSIQEPYALGAFIGGPPPSVPSSLSGTADGDDTIEVTWSHSGTDLLGFKIERCIVDEDTNTCEFEQIDILSEDAESYTDTGLTGSTTYRYRIRAYNEAADSSYATMSSDGVTTEVSQDFSWCFINTLFR